MSVQSAKFIQAFTLPENVLRAKIAETGDLIHLLHQFPDSSLPLRIKSRLIQR